MKIGSSFDNIIKVKKNETSFKAIPEFPTYLPDFVGTIGKAAGEYISMPEQKLFLATSAVMLQPLMDLKFADKDKKNDAAIKSASKAIAGGLTGVSIRAAFLKITSKYIGFNKHNKLNTYFFPDNARQMRIESEALANRRMEQYQKTLGTLFAIIFMIIFSNSKIDVPLTNDIQDLITGMVKENKSFAKSTFDVTKNRCKKIKNWFKKRRDFVVKVANNIKRIVNIIKNGDDIDTGSKGDK